MAKPKITFGKIVRVGTLTDEEFIADAKKRAIENRMLKGRRNQRIKKSQRRTDI